MPDVSAERRGARSERAATSMMTIVFPGTTTRYVSTAHRIARVETIRGSATHVPKRAQRAHVHVIESFRYLGDTEGRAHSSHVQGLDPLVQHHFDGLQLRPGSANARSVPDTA
eukprot:1229662-Rhodomonas_salina.1